MFCCKCGKQNADDSAFCNYCGAKLVSVNNSTETVQKVSQANTNQEQIINQQPVVNQVSQKKKKSAKPAIIAIASILGVAVIGAGGYFLWDQVLSEKINPPREIVEIDEEDEDVEETVSEEVVTEPVEEQQPVVSEEPDTMVAEVLERTSFIDSNTQLNYNADLVPCVDDYYVEADLSNVVNLNQFYFSDSQRQALYEDGFFVMNGGSSEFSDEYEFNRYSQVPNFVTVDSLMHTYHIYFAYLLKNTEKDYLADSLKQVSEAMYEVSLAQYEELKGTAWEDAAKRNVAFFAIGASLQDISVNVPAEVQNVVDIEMQKIMSAEGIDYCSLLNGEYEDYSQYLPRGYYEGDEQLENYFRAMMWYGRISFVVEDEDMCRSALLMSMGLQQGAITDWDSIYTVTSFFAGASDDLGYYELYPAFLNAYGAGANISDLTTNDSAWDEFYNAVNEMDPPAINSIPIEDGEDNEILCYRFMGQRFSVDADIMQNLIYSNVGPNSYDETRMLPDVLDVAAALGSKTALDYLITSQGVDDYDGYMENMEELRDAYIYADDSVWNASLYSCWLNTLRPLLEPKGYGYPKYMQSLNWTFKDLETFAGSYTELKHDTILYSKQVMAEMGGGDDEVIDDRGFVDPEPLVYARFEMLALKTAEGLAGYGMISDEDAENLQLLADLANQLTVISEKELVNETLTDEEYELIRSYGGNIEHFWFEAMCGMTGEDYVDAREYPCPLVADIATDPNGQVLEIANGGAETIYVVVPVDGELKIARGSVYSFYQFPWYDGRLTDTDWRVMMGFELNDNNEYAPTDEISKPDWTSGYRLSWGD